MSVALLGARRSWIPNASGFTLPRVTKRRPSGRRFAFNTIVTGDRSPLAIGVDHAREESFPGGDGTGVGQALGAGARYTHG